jgi:hypothetical protein
MKWNKWGDKVWNIIIIVIINVIVGEERSGGRQKEEKIKKLLAIKITIQDILHVLKQ